MGATDPSVSDDPDRPVDRAAVRERLDRVHDPELDRSIVELEYVKAVEIDGGAVAVAFVLPTAWCSPAFAWMMATGIRDEVEALPGADSVTVTLEDHMHGEQITRGVNERRDFEEVFAEADDGVAAVQEKLDEKARFARQYEVMTALRDAGLDPEQITTLRRGDVDLEFTDERASVSIRDGTLSVTLPKEPLTNYLEKARATGLVTDDAEPLLTDRDGESIETGDFERVRREARLATANIEGQATICASLHEARNGVELD